MKMDSEQVLDSIFLSYNKILKRFQLLGVTTKYGKEITHKDLRKTIEVMLKKNPTCRWRSKKVRSRKYLVFEEEKVFSSFFDIFFVFSILQIYFIYEIDLLLA